VKGDIKTESFEQFFVISPTRHTPRSPTRRPRVRSTTTTRRRHLDQRRAGGEGTLPHRTTPFTFAVTLTNPSSTTVGVHWKGRVRAAGGAGQRGRQRPGDRRGRSRVRARRDAEAGRRAVNKTATKRPPPWDKFRVDLSTPTGGAGLLRAAGYGMIFDDDQADPRDRPRGRLRQRPQPAAVDEPLWSSMPSRILVRFSVGAGCSPPTSTTDGTGEFSLAPGTAGSPQLGTDPNALTNGTEYCYTSSWTIRTTPSPPTKPTSPPGCRRRHAVRPRERPGQVEVLPGDQRDLPGATRAACGRGARPSNDGYVHGWRAGSRASGPRLELGQPRLPGAGPLADRHPRGRPRMYITTQDGWVTQSEPTPAPGSGHPDRERTVHRRRRALPASSRPSAGLQLHPRSAPGWRRATASTPRPPHGRRHRLLPPVGDPWSSGPSPRCDRGLRARAGVLATFSAARASSTRCGASSSGRSSTPCSSLGAPEGRRHSHDRLGLGNVDSSPSLRGERLYVVNNPACCGDQPPQRRHLDVFLTGAGNIRGFPSSTAGGKEHLLHHVVSSFTSGPSRTLATT